VVGSSGSGRSWGCIVVDSSISPTILISFATMNHATVIAFLLVLATALQGSFAQAPAEWPFDAAGRGINIRDGELRSAPPLPPRKKNTTIITMICTEVARSERSAFDMRTLSPASSWPSAPLLRPSRSQHFVITLCFIINIVWIVYYRLRGVGRRVTFLTSFFLGRIARWHPLIVVDHSLINNKLIYFY